MSWARDLERVMAAYAAMEESEQSKLFANAAFGYWKVTVERPLRLHSRITMIATTYPAANSLVARLEALGILREMTGQKRHRRFCYQPYIELFGDSPQEVVA